MTVDGGAPEGGMWSSPQDLVGTILADRYEVQKVVGDGGMGSVFLAEHITLRKKVALKVLHPELCRDQTHVDRFLQEARAASMIQHENIVDIVDFGNVPGGSVFFAMEYLEGRDLAGALKRDGRMPWPRVQNFMLQIVRALAAAHDKGIIHRDLKPANCFVIIKSDGREFIKLLDFGIAKVTDAENDKGLTRTGAVFGTAKYMAPEQACGEPADNRTDIYAAAVLMYELLTGVVPFDGDNFMRVLSRHLTEPLTLPTTMAPDAGIPPMVESIVVKALSKKREDRYQSMGEFEEALLALGPDGTLRSGGAMMGMSYSTPIMVTNPPSGAPAPLDAPGHTQWMGPQASHGPPSQPPEGRGGTLLLDGDSVPPDFMNQPGAQGPTGWSADPPGGSTVMMDGMGQDVLPGGPGAAAITRNPPALGGSNTNPPSPETRPPVGADPTYMGEEPSRKGFIALIAGGAVAAIGLGGLVAWLLTSSEGEEPSTETTPVVAKANAKDDPKPETKTDPVADPAGDSAVDSAGDPTAPDPTPEAEGGDDMLVLDGGDDDGGDDGALADDGDDDGALADDGDDGGGDDDGDDDGSTVETPTKPTRTPTKTPKVVDIRSKKDLAKGFGRASKAAKGCGKTHGAIPGQSITIEAAIKSNGQVLSANATGPSRSSPLGKCIAAAVQKSARFVASKQALQTEKNTYKM